MKLLPDRVVGALLSLVIASASLPVRAEEPSALPFAPGETLTYSVKWSIFPAGRVTVTLLAPSKDSGGDFEVKTTARSTGLVSALYSVKDEFHSFFNPTTLCSNGISKMINEGHRHRETHIRFDYAQKLAILDEHGPTKPQAPAKHDEKEIPACVEDVVSAFYYLRSQPLEVGKDVKLAVNDGSKTSEVVVEVQGREKIQTGLGTRMAIRVEPKVFGSLYSRKGRMLIWLSDDAQHLPLRIKMMITLGDITGTLASVTSANGDAEPASESEQDDPQQ